MRATWLCLILTLFGVAAPADAEVVRIEITRRDDAGTHERIIGRVHFAVDPAQPANRRIADLARAPVNGDGRVEFVGDLLYFQPKQAERARGTVFLEVVNRGRDQALGLLSEGRTTNLDPASWDLGDRFLLEQGFAVAFLGWQFDVAPADGLRLQVPTAPVEGLVRATYVDPGVGNRLPGFALPYCVADTAEPGARLTFRTSFEQPPVVVPREDWRFSPNGCAVLVAPATEAGAFEATYTAKGSPVAGLGMAALRDFASYLKYGGRDTLLRETPALSTRVVGFGYSQSGRLLREFVRDGFNADERGRQAFDGLLVASAGAGGGSFNHRFAIPGQAGNSVLSILRPVDLPPFDDEALLAQARTDGVVPRIMYTFTSTEYWARAGSLTHTTGDGSRDVPLADSSRLYLLSSTAHSGGPRPGRRGERFRGYQHGVNFAEQRWVLRALLVDLDDWVRGGMAPPASRYPTVSAGTLVARERVRFPSLPGLPFAGYLPPVFRMNLGDDFATTRVITREPPTLGDPYVVLVPQVDGDGNDQGGVAMPDVAVPLGTFTGWNRSNPPIPGLRYLAGLVGTFEPFALTREDRMRSGDPRLSLEERYRNREDFIDKVRSLATGLVRDRLLRAEDVEAVVAESAATWQALSTP